MIVTEEEAKTKRCQESFGDRYTTKDGAMIVAPLTGGVQPVVTSPSFCIGSACMAWRWRDKAVELSYSRVRTENENNRGFYFRQGYEDDPENPGYLRIVERPASAATGYCGKAGKP
jgi:hypothetical protein